MRLLGWARQRPAADDGLDAEGDGDGVGLRFRDRQARRNAEYSEAPVRSPDKPGRGLATRCDSDMAEIQEREQEETKSGAEEPDRVGGLPAIEPPGEPRVRQGNQREQTTGQEVDESEAGVKAVSHE